MALGSETGRRLAGLFNEDRPAACSDAGPVERFVLDRSERTFAATVDRHGPRVVRVRMAVAGDRHSAEDCFQATFPVLPADGTTVRLSMEIDLAGLPVADGRKTTLSGDVARPGVLRKGPG